MLPFSPPLAPMLAKLADALPSGDGWIYEPKWDGFRALVFKDGDDVYLQSRDEKPILRYFPELEAPLARALPHACVLDGEIVIARSTPEGSALDFEALLLRIHPAASRVKLLASQTPASIVLFDLLALGGDDLRAAPQETRRAKLEHALAGVERRAAQVHLTPATRDRAVAQDWFTRFEGAGLDGVVAKATSLTYQPGKRVMVKVKHARTADCVVAGFRWAKGGEGELVGSLLLGLYDADGRLQHVGVTASFTREMRARLARELAPLRVDAMRDHPWKEWGGADDVAQRMPGATSRWNRGKDLSWQALRPERVCEVAYDHLQGTRFRHATTFKRWRPDKRPEDCRYDQLEETPAYELSKIFGAHP